MPYIPVEERLPGVTGLLEYRKDTGEPLRELTQLLLRGPSSLTEAERELIASVVSYHNECSFCTTAHTAAVDLLIGRTDVSQKAKEDIETAPVSEKMKALLRIAIQVQTSGRNVSSESIQRAKDAGASEIEIHDTVLIAALFCLQNRYVDGLATTEPENPDDYINLAVQQIHHGYHRVPKVYERMNKNIRY